MRERAVALTGASSRANLAVSQCPAIDGMQTLLQLDLFKQEVRYQAAKTGVLELKLPNLALFAPGRNVDSVCISHWP